MKTYPPAQASHTPQADAVPQLIAATAHTLPEQGYLVPHPIIFTSNRDLHITLL